MTEHKFTDEEIIRALGCCLTVDVKGCGECPYRDENCINRIMTNALDLINRQKAEIEDLKDKNEHLAVFLAEAKTEAVKEFAEKLKEEACYLGRAVAMEDIDNIAKEIIGGEVCETNTTTER